MIGPCRQTLAAPLILTVEALEQTLHDADRARNPQQQAELMAQRGQLHAFSGHFADRMLDAVADALIRLREPTAHFSPGSTPPPLPGMFGLSLVDEHEVDRDLLLTAMCGGRRCVRPTRSTCWANAWRTGGSTGLRGRHLPLAPQALCAMLRRIAEQDSLTVDVQLALYRSFERQVLNAWATSSTVPMPCWPSTVLPGLVSTPIWRVHRAPGGSSPSRWAVVAPRRLGVPPRH